MNLIKFLTPTNLAAEKEKFFASKTYHPTFNYLWDQPASQQWAQDHSKYATLLQAVTNQDFKKIVSAASQLFDTELTPNNLAYARQITSQRVEPLPQPSIPETETAFTHAFNQLGLSEYSLEVVDQHGFNFRPAPKNKQIIMSKHLQLDFFSVDGEVKHELAHIIRHENGKHNAIPKAKNYLPTEEGLATFCQDYTGAEGHRSLFQHAAEYTMTEVALQGSLRDMIEYLQSIGFSADLAWQRAVRHKFGWIDTCQPGGIMKPSMYFYHQQKIKALTDDQRFGLFVGKISLEQLEEFDRYQGRIEVTDLHNFYRFV